MERFHDMLEKVITYSHEYTVVIKGSAAQKNKGHQVIKRIILVTFIIFTTFQVKVKKLGNWSVSL